MFQQRARQPATTVNVSPSVQLTTAASCVRQVVSDQLCKVVFSGLYVRMHAAFVTCCGLTQEDADACASLVRLPTFTNPCHQRLPAGAAAQQHQKRMPLDCHRSYNHTQ